jgi:hypothetical protein
MEYMDVRIRIPVSKLGSFVLSLPDWAQMVGYDKLISDPKPEPAKAKAEAEAEADKQTTKTTER